MPLEGDGDGGGDDRSAVHAFRIADAAECDALFTGELALQTNNAWPTTALAWLKLHQGNLAAHSAPNANLAWWLSLQDDAQSPKARALAYVPPQLPCFAGHFPGQPLLPGVIQLQWAVDLANKLWPETTAAEQFAGSTRLKFKSPVKPGDLIALQLARSKRTADSEGAFRTSVQFELKSASLLLTSGRLNYRE